MKYIIPPLFLCLFTVFSNAQNQNFIVKGKITGEDGQALPYATVFIKETGTGTVANDIGYYEISLPSGTYHLVFQYVGMQNVERQVELVDGAVSLDVRMPGQVVMLKNVVVTGKDEDPAYAIIRKAIAKAKYHKNQVDSSSANIYIKGKGRLLSAPFYLRKPLEKEGIDSTKLFLSETYSLIQYKRPDIIDEKVISVRTKGPQEATAPMEFLTGNFYDPKIGNVISPLSPKAFAYYRYEYLGIYKEGGYEISKIRVIPRVRNEYVVEGVINIVEDYFNIHSLDFSLVKSGITIDFEQVFKPIEGNAWLPVTHKFFIHGKFMGLAFEYTYLASVSNYHVILNPDLPAEMVVVDEKTETPDKDTGEHVEREDVKKALDRLTEGEEVTTKELRKVLKSYEKEEKADMENPNILFQKNFKVDSMAYKRDSVFWKEMRPIPLNKEEIKGYEWLDSLSEVKQAEAAGDTATSKDRSNFKFMNLITGARYKVGDKTYFSLDGMKAGFNTVEGWNLETSVSLTKTYKNMNWLKIRPIIRYGFSGKEVYSYLNTQYGFGNKMKRNDIHISGGRYVYQFNEGKPISSLVNSAYSLLIEENYMKLYEKLFVHLSYTKKLSKDLRFGVDGEWSRRKQLFNSTDFVFFDNLNKEYTPNAPINTELPDISFDEHDAFIVGGFVEYRPGVKFGRRNDQLFELFNNSPVFGLNYKGGLRDVAGDVNFHHLSVSGEYKIGLWRNSLNAKVEAGTFLNSKPDYFIDFQHFMGNRTIFALSAGNWARFRLLDYYLYSVNNDYFSTFLQYHPSRFLLSQFEKIRASGYKEYLFVNYLYTPNLNHYFETGIAFDNIFRVIKVEAVTSFQDGKYKDFGVRIGFSTFLNFTNNSVSVGL